MVREFMGTPGNLSRGNLFVKNLSSDSTEVFYVPSKQRFVQLGLNSKRLRIIV